MTNSTRYYFNTQENTAFNKTNQNIKCLYHHFIPNKVNSNHNRVIKIVNNVNDKTEDMHNLITQLFYKRSKHHYIT